MKKSPRETEFEKSVNNKFNLYNSLFLNLPFQNLTRVGWLIPLLNQACRQGLDTGKDPLKILDSFFKVHTNLASEQKTIDFMFRVIQYVERQIVLYDSAEDAAFAILLTHSSHLSLKECIHLADNKKKTSNLVGKLSEFSVQIVFTAHPTQFYPRSVLDIIASLRSLISENKINEIDLCLQQLGLTSLMNAKKPTPLDEAKNIIYFLRSVYYDAMGDFYTRIKKMIPVDGFDNPSIIQLGFWPGGDRDGNPFVTAETTAQVADELRMTLMKCYYQEVKRLEPKLTFRGIADDIARLREQLYITMFDPLKAISTEEILKVMNRVKTSLIENFNGLYSEELDAFIDKINIFRTHFTTLDIRQNHIEHKRTIETILKIENRISRSLDELSKEEPISLLIHDPIKVHPDQFQDETVKDTLRTILQIKSIQGQTITSQYGTKTHFLHNCEQLLTAGLSHVLSETPAPIAETSRQILEKMALLISGNRFLMEEEPISRRSIKIREEIVLPLLVIQQYAFQKIEKKSDHLQAYKKIIERSLYGNINASRNSA